VKIKALSQTEITQVRRARKREGPTQPRCTVQRWKTQVSFFDAHRSSNREYFIISLFMLSSADKLRAPPTLTSQANFTLMMECTPESGRYHSVYSVVATGTRHFSRFDSSVCCLFRILIRIRQKVPDPAGTGSTTLGIWIRNIACLHCILIYLLIFLDHQVEWASRVESSELGHLPQGGMIRFLIMIPDPAHAALTMTFKTPPNVTNYSQVFHSVADPGCLSWIPDPNFFLPG
jgi:hypothetical protein